MTERKERKGKREKSKQYKNPKNIFKMSKIRFSLQFEAFFRHLCIFATSFEYLYCLEGKGEKERGNGLQISLVRIIYSVDIRI